MHIHVVRAGERVWSISQQYGVSVDQIVALNRLEAPESLVPGIALVIPVPRQHVVQRGESLWLIANRYGTTVQALTRANDIADPSLVYVGQVLTIPDEPQPTIESNAYLETAVGPERGATIVSDVADWLTYVSMFSYRVQPDGSVVQPNDAAAIQAARADRAGPLLVLTNFTEEGFSSELARSVLDSSAVQDVLIENLLSIMRQKLFIGINIDFEYVFPEDREKYNTFLRRSAPRFREAGFSISTAVAPKTGPEQTGLLYTAHDYPTHGAIVDYVILMTYEWGWSGGPPMAVAPINQVRRVLDYAVTVIPRNKIMMGMPLYGYDWTLPYEPGTTARIVSPQQAIRLAVEQRVDIAFDTVAQSPFYYYTDERGRPHVVWFEDARSVEAKFNTVKAYGLRGVSYWVLGQEFPQNWALLRNRFNIRKYL